MTDQTVMPLLDLPESLCKVASTFGYTPQFAQQCWQFTTPLRTQVMLEKRPRVSFCDYSACFATFLKQSFPQPNVSSRAFFAYLVQWMQRPVSHQVHQQQLSETTVTRLKAQIDMDLQPLKQNTLEDGQSTITLEAAAPCKLCHSDKYVTFNATQTRSADEGWTIEFTCHNTQSHPNKEPHCWGV